MNDDLPAEITHSLQQRPASVLHTLWLLALVSLLAIVATVLVAVRHDEVALAWAEGNPAARKIVESQGLDALHASGLVPSFLPLAIVATVVFIMLVAVLVPFFYEAHGWARVMLSAIAAFGVFVSALVVARGVPAIFEVLAGLATLACFLWLVMLWHRDTTAFIRGDAPPQ